MKWLGRVDEPGKRDERLLKLLARMVGSGYFGLPRTSEWDTAMHEPMNSLDDIDRMGAGLSRRPSGG